MASALLEKTFSNIQELGTVKVTRELKLSPIEVWQAISYPDQVAQWFGTLSAPLEPDQTVCLSFGDGDFFQIQDILLEPPYILKYSWRFLGIGPLDTIIWRIRPAGRGCKVTVMDAEPERTRESAVALRQGWLDFTSRLKEFLTKSKPTRYPWRHDLDGSIELAASTSHIWDFLFETRSQSQWLPLEASSLVKDAKFILRDETGSSALLVSDVVWKPPQCVSFNLWQEGWLAPTHCKLEVVPRENDTLLCVSHNNWEVISSDEEYQKRQRTRFCAMWIDVLKRARNMI